MKSSVSRHLLALTVSLFVLLGYSLHAQTPSATPTSAAEKLPTASATVAPSPTTALSYSEVHVDGPYVAMTFDDGPSPKLTPELLDILAARHIHATFFVIGENAERHPEILQRAVREGHEIGSHTFTHPALAKLSDAGVRRELQKTDDVIRKAIGKSPTLLRPPYGSITARQKKWIHDEFGYTIVLWDVDPDDWKNPGPAVVTSRIVRQTHAGSIILSHDIHAGTIKSVPATLDQLQAKGFKFVTVSQLIAMRKPKPAKESATESPARHSSPSASPAGFAFPTPSPSTSPAKP
ncbi:MAG TPA: polysaccharide deacetylase family protein [Chthoniobacterales bacterium]|nr:polysaccharide deacetylase family protein [Chthoniobacterales bacterium]